MSFINASLIPLNYITIGFSAIIALSFGSFLNMVIYRLPLMIAGCSAVASQKINLLKPSQCTHCHYKLNILDNIPVLSYVMLKGRCRNCKINLSIRYPSVEIISTIICVYTLAVYGITIVTIALCLLWLSLIALAFIDFKHLLLPDTITIPLILIGLTLNLFNGLTSFGNSVAGALLGYLFLFAIAVSFGLIIKKKTMGKGDFKLFAAIGAWFGFASLPVILLLSSFCSIIIYFLLSNDQKNKYIPYGTAIAIATFTYWIFQKPINNFIFY
ncbi:MULTISPECIES: prepilin peptidase [Cysteiniphilum]|uniref:prepilin peptidase n=1 Tax=Cysteiniphilum TaxID=2056696 RepID=UPI000E3502D3|nr:MULTISPECIES: A24 family peptidase [Cysteiniphilum]